jgi:uncharacterized membrane protein (DUF106 family)
MEIIVIILAVVFVGIIFGIRIYKIATHKRMDECDDCRYRMKRAVKKFKREQMKKKKAELK